MKIAEKYAFMVEECHSKCLVNILMKNMALLKSPRGQKEVNTKLEKLKAK